MYLENNLSIEMNPSTEKKLARFNKELLEQDYEPVRIGSDTATGVT